LFCGLRSVAGTGVGDAEASTFASERAYLVAKATRPTKVLSPSC
jgi:hypothetical protein